jgi:sensor histidine kinase YesM
MSIRTSSSESGAPSARHRRAGVVIIALLSGALALATASECHSITHLPSLIYGIVLWGWWGCIAAALWLIGSHKPSVLRFSLPALCLQVLLGFILALAHLLLMGAVSSSTPEWHAQRPVLTDALSLNRFGIEILIYGFIFGIAGIVQFQIRAQRDAIRALELEKQLSAAQLRALQMQLEPHFLFNTLNAITTLVELGRQAEAAEMLGHLNALLKSTLKRTAPEKVPLSQELEIVENYLAIEQVRFADRLHIEIRVDPGALDSLVPCFLLQPIVENAIRHGIAPNARHGWIEIHADRTEADLTLQIRDSGDGLPPERLMALNRGVGLENTRARLEHLYPSAFQFSFTNLDRGFCVTVRIPFQAEELNEPIRVGAA